MADEPEIILSIVRAVALAPSTAIPRMRFAVTFQEYEEIRQYCLKRDGRFHGRLRNCGLYIEENPDNPLLWVEFDPKVA